MVSQLDWCLPSVVPSDFLEPILHALPFFQSQHLPNMCRHVHSYVALAATGELRNIFGHKVLLPPKKIQPLCNVLSFFSFLHAFKKNKKPETLMQLQSNNAIDLKI